MSSGCVEVRFFLYDFVTGMLYGNIVLVILVIYYTIAYQFIANYSPLAMLVRPPATWTSQSQSRETNAK